VPPQFTTIDTMSPPALDTLVRSIEKEWAYGAALLHGFERYQGALAASNEAGEILQLRATGTNASTLARQIEDTQDALRSWADEAALDPELAGVALAAADLPAIQALYARLRTTGFTADEIAQLHTLGHSDDDIDAIRDHAFVDPSDLPVDTPYPDILRTFADGLDDLVDAYDSFSSEMFVVAARIEPDAGRGGGGNLPPTADAGGDRTLDEAAGGFNFTGNASSDTDGVIASYTWHWDDGSADDVNPFDYIVHVLGVGDHTVQLTVTDDQGASDTDTITVTVDNVPPNVVTESSRRVPPGVSRPVRLRSYLADGSASYRSGPLSKMAR
jgi:hypothetical protein